MATDNTVVITGNLTRDPELRYTPGGSAVAEFGLAWNRRFQRDGEWEEEPHYFDVTVWTDLAEHAAESLQRGARVTVTGRLAQESWETKDGEKRSKVKIVAEDVAPSLRWATAEVTKVEGGGKGGRSNDRQQSSRSGSGGGSRQSSGRASGGRSSFEGEEPF